MNHRSFFLITLIFLISLITHAEAPIDNNNIVQIKIKLEKILEQNRAYIDKKGPDFFHVISQGQMPEITLVSCSDSRVHTSIVDETPEGNLFIVKNIGNQISTAAGSVKYGVNHLHTPLLLILGHSQCGAITAASQNQSGLEPGLVEELKSIHLKTGENNIEGVKTNVNNQVALALKIFEQKVKNGKLVIVGAVYDFSNDMHQGAGKLNIINFQGRAV